MGMPNCRAFCDDADEGARYTRGEDPVMPVMPGAEPFTHAGGATGVLLCHGLTGSPQSLRPWAEYLAEAGLSVWLPRLPGPGTTGQEMAHTRGEGWDAAQDRAFDERRARS